MAPPVSGIESRREAWRILREQEATGAYLKNLFSGLGTLPANDADLVRAICLGVIRRRRLLDFNLDAHAPRGIKNGKLRQLLRVGAYQILYLSGVPDFAAVNTTVELAKEAFGKGEAGFANAVLKAVARDGLKEPKGNDMKSLAIRHSHPEWLVRRWNKALKPQALEAALVRNNEEAPLWVRMNPRKASPQETVAAIESEGAVLEPHAEVPGFYRIAEGVGVVLRGQSFADGKLAFQDPVSAWVIALLDWNPGLSFLDACSAPGGKAALALERAWAASVADAASPASLTSLEGARIVCADLSPFRLKRLEDAQRRLGHGELMPVAADGTAPPFKALFDRVLLDAPCSNLGVLRRRPEARWHWTPEKTAALASRQVELLEGAAAMLKPGGRLVYATCSAESEETLDVVRAFLARHADFKLEPPGERIPEALQKQGCLWLYPGETDYDGFFAAALVRDEFATSSD